MKAFIHRFLVRSKTDITQRRLLVISVNADRVEHCHSFAQYVEKNYPLSQWEHEIPEITAEIPTDGGEGELKVLAIIEFHGNYWFLDQ